MVKLVVRHLIRRQTASLGVAMEIWWKSWGKKLTGYADEAAEQEDWREEQELSRLGLHG